MSVVATINGIPLFSTPKLAEQWASKFNIKSYHTHKHKGKMGYMGGVNHAQAVLAFKNHIGSTTNINTSTNIRSNMNQTNRGTRTSSTNTNTSGGTGRGTSGGGGGGY